MKINIPGTDDQKIRRVAKEDPMLKALLTKSLPEVQTWLDENVTNSTQAINLLKRLTIVVWFLARGLKQTASIPKAPRHG